MNKEIMKAVGFTKEVELVNQSKCPFCETQLKGIREEFRNDKSFKEFHISGLCQSCQDNVFK